MECDPETNNDFFQPRYMSSPQGRFTSPGPLETFVADPTNPQTWNLYSYASNNTLVNIDPTGATCVTTQVQNADGTVTNSVADNGDGQGCAAAQVAPTQNNQTPSDLNAWDVAPQQENVNAQQGSFVDLLLASDVPLSPSAQEGAQAIHNAFAILPAVCSVTFSVNAGAQGGRMRIGAEYNTAKGLALRGRAQGGIGPVPAGATTGPVTITTANG
jgi:RHS repeat-associated protein